MSDMKNYAIAITESITKEAISIAEAGIKSFFKYENLGVIPYAKDSYFNARLKIRLEDFIFEENKLNNKEKENFYNNINNERLNYLFELLDSARTAIFDTHAKILSKIYFNLLKNGSLSEYDIVLLMNISSISFMDFTILKTAINSLDARPNHCVYLKNWMEITSVQKFMALGVFDLNANSIQDNEDLTPLAIKLNNFALYMKNIMENII